MKRNACGRWHVAAMVAFSLVSPCSPLIEPPHSEAAEIERLRVGEDLSDPGTVRNCLSAVCEATNSESLDGFLDCFTSTTRKKLRRPAAMLFVQHEVSMELLESQVIEQTEDRTEAAVKYRTKRSDDTYTVVSLVDFKKENGYWKISKERIQTVEHQSPSTCSPERFACFGGQCQIRN